MLCCLDLQAKVRSGTEEIKMQESRVKTRHTLLYCMPVPCLLLTYQILEMVRISWILEMSILDSRDEWDLLVSERLVRVMNEN